MNYIVLDLEWNQPEETSEKILSELPFEIIEIGAVKMDENGNIIGRFSELIKPEAYHFMNNVTSKLLHLKMEELNCGKPFGSVMENFLVWCGKDDYLFCTWGPQDLTELQRNMKYHGMPPLSKGPIKFYDVQKLFAYIYEEDKKSRRTLEYAVDYLGIGKDAAFHRAYDDAFYTSGVLSRLFRDGADKFSYVSYDVFCPPAGKKDEIKVQFESYAKYISRVFDDRTEAMRDREVISTRCYLCHKNLKKKIRWFAANPRHYYSLAFCEKHGYLKGKIRMFKTDGEKVFVVKTTRLISDQEAETVIQKRKKTEEARRKRRKQIS